MSIEMKKRSLRDAMTGILDTLGYGHTSDHVEHTDETARRWAEMMVDLTQRPVEFKFTVFDNQENVNEMIVSDGIPFYTLCAHHVIPFFGKAHIAYIPNKKIVGLSKLPRAVEHFAKGLQVQEKLTTEIADFLEAKLDPQGVAVVLRGEHLCVAMRGVRSQGVMTTTSALRGAFDDHSKLARQEFLTFIGNRL